MSPTYVENESLVRRRSHDKPDQRSSADRRARAAEPKRGADHRSDHLRGSGHRHDENHDENHDESGHVATSPGHYHHEAEPDQADKQAGHGRLLKNA